MSLAPLFDDPVDRAVPSQASAPTVAYGPESNANAKTELVAFAQRKTGKSMLKGDIVYKNEQYEGDLWQSTVQLNCLGGEEYAGELSDSEKAAEQAAAHQALVVHATEVAEYQSKRKQMEALGFGSSKKARMMEDLDGIDPNVKGKLHTAVKQLLGREADQNDIVYDIIETATGMVASLTLPTLCELYPDLGVGTSWIGEASTTKQKTRLSAATQALESLLALPEAAEVDLTLANTGGDGPKNRGVTRPSSSVGGKGSSTISAPLGAYATDAIMSKGKGKMMAMMKGKAKGKGKDSFEDMASFFHMMGSMFGAMASMKGGKGKGGKGKGESSSPWDWGSGSW